MTASDSDRPSDNLMQDPLIGVRIGEEEDAVSLPGVLARLSTGTELAFPALMPHQKHAWFAFLVQLAAIALHRAGVEDLPSNENEWTGLLRGLTSDFEADEPWRLVVEELSRPAFMQPPVPDGSLKGFKGPFDSPDDIEVVITSKNHDIKSNRIPCPSADHWVFGLITLQTMQGFLGAGNYGIARMNGGFASRPCIGLVSDPTWAARFLRDVQVLVECRKTILNRYEYYCREDGLVLLWLEPWEGKSSLALNELDPYFIEVCRRVRLAWEAGSVQVYMKATKAARIAAKEIKGDTGDPWTPVRAKDGAALTVSARGLNYDLLQNVLFSPEYRPATCQETVQGDSRGPCEVLASALVRGQGKTEGLHERMLPFPEKARSILLTAQGRDEISRRSKERVEDAGTLAKKALKPALLSLLQGGKDDLDFRDVRTRDWRNQLDSRVDEIFFPALWEDLELDDETARTAWRQRIVKEARGVLRQAEAALPIPAGRRYRALASADNAFEAGVAKNFKDLRNRKKEA